MPLISATLATADQLHEFAGKDFAAQELLPQIIRRLVLASVPTAKEIDFPTGKSINTGGWDGHVESSGSPRYVPAGISGWELSVRKDQKAKADEDYTERVTGILDPERSITTFVHWTLRKWSTRAKWASAQRAKGDWADVQAYDAQDLETWLLDHLAVHLWVSKQIKVMPNTGAVDIVSHWQDWSGTPERTLPPEIVIRGYEGQRDALLKGLADAKSTLSIQWERADLAVAFVAACLATSSSLNVEKLAARCVVVKTEEAFEELVTEREKLILVTAFTPASLGLARQKGHTVVLTLGRDSNTGADIVLSGRRPSELFEALATYEPDDDQRRLLSDRATRKFTSFYRSLIPAGTYPPPSWSKAENVPLLMAGRWDSSYPGDGEALAALTRRAFEEENARAIELSKVQDALFHQNGKVLFVADLEDAWAFLGRHVTDQHLDRFAAIVSSVFAEPDPQYLAADQEEANTIAMFPDRQGRLVHSMSIRRGIAETLCYLGSNGEGMNESGDRTANVAAHMAIRRLFDQADDWARFCSIAPWFQQFAEASPDEFLKAVEKDLKSNPEKIRALFRDKDHSFFGSSSPHTFMLWALELLAWSPDHLTRAALALARLQALDSGGTLANRPLSSLREIFLSWHPGTLATIPQRIQALREVADRAPETGWALLVSLLPGGQEVSMQTAAAKYRPWGPLWQVPLTRGDVWAAIDGIVSLAIEKAGTDPARLATLVSKADDVPDEGLDRLIRQVRASLANADEANLSLLRETLRKLIAQHRAYPDADWSMSPERIELLQGLLDEIPSGNPSQLLAWLFNGNAIFEFRQGDDFGQKQEELEERRASAANEIYEAEGLEKLLEVASGSETPWMVGQALLRSRPDLDLLEIGKASVAKSRDGEIFFMGVLEAKTRKDGIEEGLRIATSKWAESLLPEQRTRLLRSLPFDAHLIEELTKLPEQVQRVYWAGFGKVDAIRAAPELVEPAMNRLMELGLYESALDSLCFIIQDAERIPPATLVLDVVERSLKADVDPKVWEGHGYELGKILDFLDKADDIDPSRVGRLELIFARLLTHNRKPKRLNRLIVEEPELFILLLKSVYRAEGADDAVADSGSTEQEQLPPAMVAYTVLNNLRSLPGESDGGMIDIGALLSWVSRGHELAKQARRAEAFEECLGEWFAYGPAGTDGIYPHEAVREVFQILESDDFERGFVIGVFNARGVFSKAPDEGGAQERELAAKYEGFADALSTRWHRAALAMRRIGEDYVRNAEREDRRHGLI